MVQFDRLAPLAIDASERMRHLDEDAVCRLVQSIRDIGLQTPISVRWAPDEDAEYSAILIAGAHRLEAVKRLGWDFIDVAVHEGDERDARLWEIAENLHRSELTVLERSEHVAEWVRLTEEKMGQVAPLTSEHAKRGAGRGNEGGIRAAARDLGVEHTQARRAVKVDALTPEAKDAAREAGLDDNQSALLRVASAPSPTAQLAAIKQEADKAEARKRNAGAIRDEKERAEVEMVEALLGMIDLGEVATWVSWLTLAGATNVAKMLSAGANSGAVFDSTSAGRAA